MKLESRYLVLKRKDMEERLTPEDMEVLANICDKLEIWREVNMRDPLVGVVIEKDWPEYEPTLKLLSERVDREKIAQGVLEYGRKLKW